MAVRWRSDTRLSNYPAIDQTRKSIWRQYQTSFGKQRFRYTLLHLRVGIGAASRCFLVLLCKQYCIVSFAVRVGCESVAAAYMNTALPATHFALSSFETADIKLAQCYAFPEAYHMVKSMQEEITAARIRLSRCFKQRMRDIVAWTAGKELANEFNLF